MLTLTMEKLRPFLPSLTSSQETRVTAWLPVLELLLNGRYGDRITTQPDGGNEVVFVSASADAIMNRLSAPSGQYDSQTIGPANVRYNGRAGLLKWFLPEQLSELDVLAGIGSIRTVRTPAADGIRFGNRMTRSEIFPPEED